MDNTIKLNEVSADRQKEILETSLRYIENIPDTGNMESVTEAFRNFNEVPYYVLQKKIYLPFDKKDMLKGNVVILNTVSLDDSVHLMKHPNMYPMNRYKRYFIDYKYRIKIFNKIFASTNKNTRVPIYSKVDKELGLNCLTEINAARGYNFYYDQASHDFCNPYLCNDLRRRTRLGLWWRRWLWRWGRRRALCNAG